MKTSFFIIIFILFLACKSEKKEEVKKEESEQKKEQVIPELAENLSVRVDKSLKGTTSPETYDTATFNEYYREKVELPPFDLKQDIDNLNIEQLRLLRNEIFARHGYLFKDAHLRVYFDSKGWYQPPWWEENYQVIYSKDEENFIAKVRKRELNLLKNNYISEGDHKQVNIDNLINASQFEYISKELSQKLTQHSFAIVPTQNIQLFHIYEQNDYHVIPNFVTTDLILQLVHMYYNFLIQNLEEKKIINTIKQILSSLVIDCKTVLKDPALPVELKETAEFDLVYLAIPYFILTGKKETIPVKYQPYYDDEIAKIQSASGLSSKFLNLKFFDYTLFKPRGHYTHTEQLKKYFKAMIWLQTIPFPLSKELTRKSMQRMLLIACLIKNNQSCYNQYLSIYNPTSFLIGESDDLSVMNLIQLLEQQKKNITLKELFKSDDYLSDIINDLKSRDKTRIKPKGTWVIKEPTINFMPQRYLPDSEILQRLIHILYPDHKRPFPKGMDIFAVLGIEEAEKILFEVYQEQEKWEEFPDTLKVLKEQFKRFKEWDKTTYNKWLESLVKLFNINEACPFFMKTEAWAKKNLNTALASWAELRHDVILYAKQPCAAECGGWSPPDPVLVGYVEPAIGFWKNIIQLLDITYNILEKYDLLIENINSKTNRVKELVTFLLRVSQKEIKNEKLTDQEYETIAKIGSTVEYLTLEIMDSHSTGWHDVSGPDKSISVVADVYAYTSAGGGTVLEEGVGYANEIYVVVEINGYLYLTKGAVFSYYEFKQPSSNRLTDEEWQKMLDTNTTPKLPEWILDLILPIKPLKVKSYSYYSSGC